VSDNVAATTSIANTVAATDKWFIRQGLPLFVQDYQSTRYIWTRATPIMVVLLAFELLGTLAVDIAVRVIPDEVKTTFGHRESWSAVIFLIGFLAYMAWSRWKAGVWFVTPKRFTWPLPILFVLLPILGSLGAGPSLNKILTTILEQLVLLLVIYLITRYALIAVLGWSIRRVWELAGDLRTVTTKALPLLLIFLIVMFLNTEVWQAAGALTPAWLWGSLAFLFVLALMIAVERISGELQSATEGTSDRDVELIRDACLGTPLQEEAEHLEEPPPATPLNRRQRVNLWFAAVMTQAIQVGLIGMLVWAFFTAFGIATIPLSVQEDWMGSMSPDDVIWTVGVDHALTEQMLRVTTFLGGFAAFYTMVYASTDDTYKQAFAEDVGDSLARVVRVNRLYAALRTRLSN